MSLFCCLLIDNGTPTSISAFLAPSSKQPPHAIAILVLSTRSTPEYAAAAALPFFSFLAHLGLVNDVEICAAPTWSRCRQRCKGGHAKLHQASPAQHRQPLRQPPSCQPPSCTLSSRTSSFSRRTATFSCCFFAAASQPGGCAPLQGLQRLALQKVAQRRTALEHAVLCQRPRHELLPLPTKATLKDAALRPTACGAH